jgi:hypothetical protein
MIPEFLHADRRTDSQIEASKKNFLHHSNV